MKPQVSIVISTHNGSRFISEALATIKTQTFKDFEVLIVNDASTDTTKTILQQQTDHGIRVLTNATRLGLARSLNRALQEARGTYIARLDDDDLWLDPTKLAQQVAFLEANPRVGLVGTHNIVIDETGKELYRLHFPETDAAIRATFLRRNPFPHSGVLFRREILTRVGLYNEALVASQDYELWLRIGKEYQLANLPGLYIKQRVNLRGITSRRNRQQFINFVRVAYRFRQSYPGFYRAIPLYIREGILNLLPKHLYYRLRNVLVFSS